MSALEWLELIETAEFEWRSNGGVLSAQMEQGGGIGTCARWLKEQRGNEACACYAGQWSWSSVGGCRRWRTERRGGQSVEVMANGVAYVVRGLEASKEGATSKSSRESYARILLEGARRGAERVT